jgi:hypothetical protein
MRALTTLVEAAVAPEQAHDVALDALTRHREGCLPATISALLSRSRRNSERTEGARAP